MEVIILAGGLGSRLSSVIKGVPKCMAPVAGKPFLWYLLKYLTRYDVTRVMLSVGYLREVIFEWIDQVKEKFPFEFDYAIEEKPLGTGGGIKLALSKAKTENVIILNGDTFFDVDLKYLYFSHTKSGKPITLALKMMFDFDRYGSVTISPDCSIKAFNEKKHCDKGLINGGVYVVNAKYYLFQVLHKKFSFETAVLEPQCNLGNLFGVVQNGYFIDIGIPQDYCRAEIELPELI